MKTWEEIGFLWDVTGDGSPTLRLKEVTGPWETGESMHHSGGALQETLMIYGEPLSVGFRLIERPRVLSVGLGMGYVEWVAAAESVRANRKFEMVTLESVQGLVDVFRGYLDESLPAGETSSGLAEVMTRVASAREVEPGALKKRLQEASAAQEWQWTGPLGPNAIPRGPFHVILYDAFSSKTSPDLWTEDFLRELLAKIAAPDCVFTTYACTGALKRALKANGFTVEQREGFMGKRHSTVGRRGVFATNAAAAAAASAHHGDTASK